MYYSFTADSRKGDLMGSMMQVVRKGRGCDYEKVR